MSANSNSRYKGSTLARFVKNTSRKPGKVTTRFSVRNRPEPAAAANPMLNDSITRRDMVEKIDALDSMMGFDRFDHGGMDGARPRKGWLVNMHATTVPSEEYLAGYSGVDFYFLDAEGGLFKATIQHDPYFFLMVVPGREAEVEEALKKLLEEHKLKAVARELKDDLAMPNHLVGLRRTLLRLLFHNVSDLLGARRMLTPIIKENQAKRDTRDVFQAFDFTNADNEDLALGEHAGAWSHRTRASDAVSDPTTFIDDLREYDVPFHVRVSIDKNIRVGKWYDVYAMHGAVSLEEDTAKIAFADPVVLAFDIETTKAPLKFPDAKTDQIMMISYMIDGEGFLITNREIISEDIDDFEYTPKPEYPGEFTVFNEPDEKHVLQKFYEHIRDVRPTVIATFNGDFFDWPFVETRTNLHDMDMFDEIGFAKDNEGEYKSKYCVHMDCFRWVKRDSYLPQGSQGLKAVTTAKLGYNPIELDPELMTPYAYEKPQVLSEYSVSDAVATYYLYFKYVHPFIFSLCTIIPLNPDEVLRKGTGTLCEMLLMVQAYEKEILLPNKYTDPIERFYDGHLLESETYVGGHVESLESGVFRSDIPNNFNIQPAAIDELLQDLRKSIEFCIEVENGKKIADVENFDEVYEEIKAKLEDLRDNPVRTENPLIYHVDVASMYPNIMTSNRLQPDSMKTEEDCAACDFNRPGKTCDRRLEWSWRGEFSPAKAIDYNLIKRTLQSEKFPPLKDWLPARTFEELSYPEQALLMKTRLGDYSQKVHKKKKVTETVTREAIVCQRENPFYVNTVRNFRDRRYEFKNLAKVWKGKSSKCADTISRDEANKMVVLYDSLQLAHKVILNSFYGYVMRKGSRWYSMEMAGITCLTGSKIIQMARALVERIGRPLELDTDGIWCILPKSFPENFNLKCKDGKKVFLEYPCSMLNYLVHQKFTNHQYQDLEDPERFKYSTKSENSIFFEVDGPYRAMVLPTSKEEGKGLKKRYAVFNHDGSLAELKGFELKRRGELNLIKNFQSDIFKLFLDGDTLEECYKAVATVANNWLDVLDTKGGMLEDEDLIELICENKMMSKALTEYEGQKSTSITTAKRLGEFLGEEMVKDAGLACKYIISSKPADSPVTERAIPVAVFSSEKKEYFLKKWLKDSSLTEFDPRSILDWGYYYERLASVVQKIITIPAAYQSVQNPVPRVPHPDWLRKRILAQDDKRKQSSISAFFGVLSKKEHQGKAFKDIEDFGNRADDDVPGSLVGKVTVKKRKLREAQKAKIEEEEKHASLLRGTCPSMTEDYVGFLEYQKAKWNLQSRNRDRRKKLFGETSESSHRSSVGNMIRKQAENIAGTNWEILEYKIDPTKVGVVKVHLLSAGKVYSFSFNIPKQVYATFKSQLSSKKTIANCEIEKSRAVLPNGHDASNLYKFTMPETTYNEEISRVDSLFHDSRIVGLYETEISSIDRAIIGLGNTVRFDDTRVGALGKCLKTGFTTKDLIQINQAQYLKRFNMEIFYLLHLVTNSYEFFSLFCTWTNTVFLYVLKPSTGAQELPSNLEKIYKDVYEAKKDSFTSYYNIVDYPIDVKFETLYFNNPSSLYKKLNSTLRKIHEGRSSKALFAIQSPYCHKVLNLLESATDFPTIRMSVREVPMPAIGWQSLISQRIMKHYFNLASGIKNLIDLSNYSNIPLCNLQAENLDYLIDVQYARRLTENNVVLWWSNNLYPDHGGYEADQVDDLEGLESITINKPEIYETACLEIEIGTLTINTILTSSLINEMEGTDLADDPLDGDDNHGASTLAVDTFSPTALALLRSMVKQWWDDALNHNIHADSMTSQLVLWIQKRSSKLYDYTLHRHIHKLTYKALRQLVGEFRRMNAQVVFATSQKLIVQTSKISVENSYAFGNYAVNAVRSKPLFNFLDLRIVRYWDLLVWMDQFNYAGRCCTEITNEEVQDLIPFSKWHIKKFLPVMFQSEFEDWVVIFLNALASYKGEVLLGGTQLGTQRITQLAHILNGQKKQDTLNETDEDDFVSEVMVNFRKPLQQRIKLLNRRQNESILNPEMKQEYEFPKLAGSHLNMKAPVLELVKFLCGVFALSSKRSIEVRMLRRDLLQELDVREFSAESLFINPSASLTITSVICDYCEYIRDVDFCRDEDSDVWACTNCRKSYNKAAMEEELIAQCMRLVAKYLSQDYQCSRCHTIKSDNMSEFCKCSGSWTETVKYEYVEQRLLVFRNVASIYGLKMLLVQLEDYF
ncbi:DNA-directed DNA polymerase epsilon, catalytic subunit A [Metschnikowia bicuspidata var. bicuspidata NRRL YB-4993]|uniref:DNA polymerase epsilon catalytic subunit n=1 Tax=Metschnikowia bicuspidata var. bicuspidata NRRL YB-4993 TaxID=869754 RepID=A0A1A0H863_9ASCO|nr:DNA-directed DNA polymerase epsilon, catalytic subunit A [Metschnikowia bicuspidata var. bicuspidata NRRL YB-4993]OBA20211.1 DNA-directed DNA polymerase epsilon, catalytic subunit A [Metschnikowia bicuspidata var. bicuspidata NRRL YB-4993]